MKVCALLVIALLVGAAGLMAQITITTFDGYNNASYPNGYCPNGTPNCLPNGEVGVSYPYPGGAGFIFMDSQGGGSWFEQDGSSSNLPPGLQLTSDGTLGGVAQTPMTAGVYPFTIAVEYSGSTQKDFTIQIFQPLAINSVRNIGHATAGQFYSHPFAGQGGDMAAYFWTVFDESPGVCGLDGVPPGMCLSSAGVLSGTPTTPGTYLFDLDLLDNDIGNDVQMTICIVIDPAPPPPTQTGLSVSSPVNLGTVLLGNAVSGAVSANGGTSPYTFTVSGLPPGMTSSGGGISGAPTSPGLYSVGITVTDAAGSTASSSISFSVFGLAPATLPNGVTSSPYSFFFSAAGGAQPYTFSGSGFPSGFSFSGGGWLNGTPTAPGTYTVSVSVTDENGLSSSGSFPFTVTAPPPLTVPGGAITTTQVLTPFSQTLTAKGGAPPYTWTLAGGSFPDGLSLRSSGTISGTPTKPGSYSFSAKATDVTGGSGIGSFSLSISPPPLTITTPSPLTSGMVTVDYPVQVLSAAGGAGPYTFTVPANALPAGLSLSSDGSVSGTPTAAGSSAFTVTVTDSTGATGTTPLQITVRPFSADLAVSSGSLSFSLATGSTALPGSPTVLVQATDVTKILSWSASVSSTATWLSLSPATGSTPGSFSVSLTSAAESLAASKTPYQGTITVACVAPSPCAGNSQTVTVSLLVSAVPPNLTVPTDLLSFATSSAAPQATTQSIQVQNTGGGSIGFASVKCAATWCAVGSIPQSLGGGASGAINITADPTGLSSGFYYTDATIVSSVGTNAVPVSFFIAAGSKLALLPAGVQLIMPAGGVPAVPNPSFLVNVSDTSTVAWTATVLNAPWLSLTATSGSSTGTSPGTVSYSINQTAASALAQGAYYGTIRIASAGAVNSPQDFQVVLNVTAATDRQKPEPTPAGLLFLTSVNGPTPPAQTVQILVSSVPPVSYQASVATDSGNPWLSVSSLSGTTSVSSPAQPSVTVSPTGLSAGVYHGTISYAFSAAAIRTVNVTLVVEAAGLTPSQRGTGLSPAATSSCTPAQLVPTQTGLVSNFAAPASWPTPIEIQLVDDCGSPVANGQVVATFSNGDPPLVVNPQDTSSGLYSGTWTPRKPGSQVNVTATATAPGFAVAKTLISGAVVPNAAPVLNSNAVLHVFNPQVGAPLAPGTIVQVYGSGLATQTISSPALPLQTTLGGTSVIIGGLQAPLFFVSTGQINAQIPFELTAGQTYQLIVSNSGALSTPQSFQSTAVSPGIELLPSGYADALHGADGTAVTEASPAKPGENILIYLAGMGATNIPVASGSGAPSNPAALTLNTPSVTLDSENVSVSFSELTPGTAGVYQIGMQVPADAKDGDLTLVVSQPGSAGTTAILPVHH